MYQYRKEQEIPISLKQAWNFFSQPENLKLITPDYLRFNIRSKSDIGEMYPGMIITYTLSPVLNLSIKWATEITHIKDYKYFVDNQIKGPYKFWHHEHHFNETPDGIKMNDILYYDLPFGYFGKLVHKFFIRKKVENIFTYREQKIKELFS